LIEERREKMKNEKEQEAKDKLQKERDAL